MQKGSIIKLAEIYLLEEYGDDWAVLRREDGTLCFWTDKIWGIRVVDFIRKYVT